MKLLKPDNEPSHHTTLELFAKKHCFSLLEPFSGLCLAKKKQTFPNCFLQSQALCWLLFLRLKILGGQKCLTVSVKRGA